MSLDSLLRFAVEQGASDLHLQAGAVPMLRLNGLMRELDAPAQTADQIRQALAPIVPKNVGAEIDAAASKGVDFAYALPGVARFRCNLYSHLGTPAVVVRIILPKIRSVEELNLPPVIGEFALARRGLTVLSGVTGSGKSTTLAALVDLLNTQYRMKIVTIEDPVEYVHANKKSLVAHVEVGSDTPTFEHGLRQAMRQAPDVILVGELRDMETARIALRAADTGHQVFTTVHSGNTVQTIERLLAMVPAEELAIARQQLAATLVGVVSQRLVPTKAGTRRPVAEILRGDAVTSRYILENRLGELADYLATGQRGMQTFDHHLLELYHAGILSGTQALAAATNPEALDFEIRVKTTKR